MQPGYAHVGTLEARRIRAGLSQRQAALRAGIHVRSLRNYEKGRIPRMEPLHKLAALYGVDPAQLLNEIRAERPAA